MRIPFGALDGVGGALRNPKGWCFLRVGDYGFLMVADRPGTRLLCLGPRASRRDHGHHVQLGSKLIPWRRHLSQACVAKALRNFCRESLQTPRNMMSRQASCPLSSKLCILQQAGCVRSSGHKSQGDCRCQVDTTASCIHAPMYL